MIHMQMSRRQSFGWITSNIIRRSPGEGRPNIYWVSWQDDGSTSAPPSSVWVPRLRVVFELNGDKCETLGSQQLTEITPSETGTGESRWAKSGSLACGGFYPGWHAAQKKLIERGKTNITGIHLFPAEYQIGKRCCCVAIMNYGFSKCDIFHHSEGRCFTRYLHCAALIHKAASWAYFAAGSLTNFRNVRK